MTITYTIRAGTARAGQVILAGGREVPFDGSAPDPARDPIAHVAAERYIASGATSGVITITAAAS